ncbi:uncharacterized protein LOC119322789 [Triticum dicoccoides]|uniref:uncharacterized protein LOC119322789 n=1 Tax=Triticum dicoccoides TaxID=85692 RepID=UPI000E7C335D|nr:uncharacterized protein LOC119322789 [Triticum dicoccoides]
MVLKLRRSGRANADRPYRCDRSERISRNKSLVMETINGFYAAALDRLPVDEMPALVPRLLTAGLCVGFADPISNIIVNTVSSYSHHKPTVTSKSDDGKKEKAAASRRRRKALSRAVSGARKVKYWPPPRRLLRDMSIAERSLEALVAFLTYYFPDLPACEALEYLRLANADLLSAVRLVEEDRNCSGSFSFASRTTKTALKCAVLAACHPTPRAVVNRSYSLASRMEQLSQLLATEGSCLSCTTIENINRLLMKPRGKLADLAGVTPQQFNLDLNRKPLFVPTQSLRSTLLHKIYGFYLKALALLPAQDLRMCYHRGLLKAGYCYGPLMDPVSNIVLNTLWYKMMFPPEGELCVATMICSRSLVLVAYRSLCGLVAYIRACFGMMSEHQAMCYLLFTEVNLWGAIEMARQQGHTERTMHSAYMAAARAAQHPDPDAVVEFFVSTFPMMPLPMETESFVLNVGLIQELLFEYCSTRNDSVSTVPVLSEGGSKFLSCILKDFKEEEGFVCRKVNDMLKKYTQRTRGPEYELHVICGLNSNVGKAYVFGRHYGPLLSWRRKKTQHSHINFLARPRNLDSSDAVPILFFAECSNDEDVIDELSCWPVTGHPGRCYYCEKEGAKIVHPDLEKYIGRDIDFERMACDNKSIMTTEGAISDGKFITDCVDVCEEDCIYFDATRDAKCAEFLNARARSMQGPRLV